jgi:hypothetical protein
MSKYNLRAKYFNIPCHINCIYKILIFLMSPFLHSLYSVFLSRKSEKNYVKHEKFLKFFQALCSLFYTMSSSHLSICSTQYYRIMWALNLYRCPLTSQNQLLFKVNHIESTLKYGLIKLIIKRKVYAILNGFWECKTVCFSWTVWLSVCIIINIQTCVHVNGCVIVNHYILHVLS